MAKMKLKIVHHGFSKSGKTDFGYSVWGPRGAIHHSHRSLGLCESFAQAHEKTGAIVDRAYLCGVL